MFSQNKLFKTYVLIIGFVLLFVLVTSPVAAQAPTPSDNEVNRIASQLFCPVCENTPLDVCPTQACAQWRELIRLKISEGWSDNQIKDYFVEQYGGRVLSEPPREGLNWLIYIIPPVLMLVGVYILAKAFITMRNNSKRSEEKFANQIEEPEDEGYLKQIEDELNKRS